MESCYPCIKSTEFVRKTDAKIKSGGASGGQLPPLQLPPPTMCNKTHLYALLT